MTAITIEVARKVLEVVNAGLVSGMGKAIPGQMCVEAAVCYAMGEPHSDRPTCVAPSLRALKIRLNDSSWSSDRARTDGLRRLALAQLGSAGFLDESEFIQRILGVVIRKTFPVAFRAVAGVTKDEGRKAKWMGLASRCEAVAERIEPREARQFFKELKESACAAAAYADAAYAYAAAYAAYAAAAAAAYAACAAAAYADAAAAYAACADADAAYAYASKKKSDARDKSLAAFCEEVVQVLIKMDAPGCQWLQLATT
jgi:hypothetical protein